MFVIGNGQSRQQLELGKYRNIIACNAICRDMYVDQLVCVDRRMVDEAFQNYHHNFAKLYTRKEWTETRSDYDKLLSVPELPYKGTTRADDAFNWGSGPYAVLIAAMQSKKVKLIGFDLYGIDKKTNNVYKDTLHYDSSNKSAVDPRYWIYQIGKVFEIFVNTRFVIYNKNDWILPEYWNRPNVSLDKLSNL